MLRKTFIMLRLIGKWYGPTFNFIVRFEKKEPEGITYHHQHYHAGNRSGNVTKDSNILSLEKIRKHNIPFLFFHLWQHEIPDNLNAWLCNPESRLSLNEKKICSSATYHSTDTHLFIFIVWNISHILQIMSLFFLNSHWLFLTNCNICLNCKLLETESVFYSTYYD